MKYKILILFVLGMWLMMGGEVMAVKSEVEMRINPIGDDWDSAGSYNEDIPLWSYTSFNMFVGKTDLTSDEFDFLKTRHKIVMFDQGAFVNGFEVQKGISTSFDNVGAVARRLKAANPNIKVLGYFAVIKFADIQPNYFDTNFKEEWLVHKKGTDPTKKENRVLHYENAYLADVTNPGYQDYMANYIADYLNKNSLDGFLNDHVFGWVPCQKCTANPPDFSELPDGLNQNWKSGHIAMMNKIKNKIGPDKISVYNGMNTYWNLGPITDDIDFISASGAGMIERFDDYYKLSGDQYGTAVEQRTKSLGRVIDYVNQAKAADKWLFFRVAGAWLSESLNREEQLKYERFYLSFFMIFMNWNKSIFNYSHNIVSPLSEGDMYYGAMPFFKDWNTKIGTPVTNGEQVSSLVYRRRYSNGWVYWNSSDTAYSVNLDSNYVDLTGMNRTSYSLAPMTGMIFYKGTAYPTPTIMPVVPQPVIPVCISSTKIGSSITPTDFVTITMTADVAIDSGELHVYNRENGWKWVKFNGIPLKITNGTKSGDGKTITFQVKYSDLNQPDSNFNDTYLYKLQFNGQLSVGGVKTSYDSNCVKTADLNPRPAGYSTFGSWFKAWIGNKAAMGDLKVLLSRL